ncbi:squalene/phytoene synthase family protein [Skermanella sp. TT6]|uniref:Squalene/phytoene synthase family protein n=1 Tax=Skermanella cutis TaxID=2775420 RepID=A0ABX7BEV3_9PROT|nr:phytoene/squalene synthase family protein [Skermanella sp. TT6]QQP91591.1 squalene/phytoene synthase family protein [Skermanella sp. TT6]
MANSDAALSYCGQEVRKYDNDRFLTCLFAPPDRREALFALYAFNLEIAKTREVVTEPVLGQIRLQWWHDSIGEVYAGAGRRHEVLMPLADAIRRFDLTRAHFETLIDGREADLTDEPPADGTCLASYAEVTSAPLAKLALEILGVRDAPADAAARHVGIAWALTGLLRAVPFHARGHRLYLPKDVLERHGVSERSLFDLKPPEGLKGVVAEVSGMARTHLEEARALRAQVPRAGYPALLTATLADIYLGVIAKAGNDVFAPRVQMPNPFRQARLAWRAMTGRY